MKFYIDTAIWIDLLENRVDYAGEPIGEYATTLIFKIYTLKHTILISDIILNELEVRYSLDKINGLFKPFLCIQKIYSSKEQLETSKIIAHERKVPSSDVLHAILARDNGAILITRDNNFRDLADISAFYTPENFLSNF